MTLTPAGRAIETVSLATLHTDAVRRNPYAFYAELHARGPVCAVTPGESRYTYIVHGYDAVSQLLRSPDIRVSDRTRIDFIPTWAEHRTEAVFMNSMFFSNEPRHSRMRRMFGQTFTPRRITNLDPAVISIAEGLLDRIEATAKTGERIDFMREYAFPLPANVLGELLGVPEEDREWYRPRADALGRLLELGGATQSNVEAADAASVEITDYFAGLAAKRRAEPKDDLISALVQASDGDTSQLSEEELIANLVVVFNAGFVTTTHLLGNGLGMLLERPELLARLRADYSLMPSYVEEILRYDVPTHFSVRQAVNDVEIGGTVIPAGSWVLALLAAANRDPSHFPDPDTFDPDRPNTSTLSFGGGPHYCMGAALARMEGQRGLQALFERFDEISIAEPPGTPRQLMLRGYDELWLNLS